MGMRPMDPDERWCFDRLMEREARFDAVMNMYDQTGQSPRMSADQVEKARDSYKALKDDLREEHRRVNDSRLDRTAAQERWYQRPIDSAHAHLKAPTNFRPEKWYADLYTSRSDITVDLSRMRSYFGLSEDSEA
jgi:hypothetical protein